MQIRRLQAPSEVSETRITMLEDGRTIPRLPSAPLLSSANAGWEDMKLERHRLQPTPALTGTIEGYQICLHLTEPVAMTWRIDGVESSRVLRPRELCTATHGELRTVSWSAPFETLLLSFSPAMMSRVSAELGKGRTVELAKLRGFRDAQIEAILRSLHADVLAGSPAGPLFGEHLGSALALYLCQHFATNRPSQRRYHNGLPGCALRRVLEQIEERLQAPLSLAELAETARISRFYFSQLFRNSTGLSPWRYIMLRRIERAKQMLQSSRDSLQEIAGATGFSSQSHLTAVFRQHTGLTPAKYRAARG